MSVRVHASHRRQWAALFTAFTAQWSVALVAGAVPPLVPLLQPELGLTKAEVGFFSSAAFAGAWSLLLVTGSATDRFGVRKMISLGQVFAGVALLGMATAGSFLHAVAVVFAAGMGRAIALPPGSKAIADWLPPSSRATGMGIAKMGVPVAGIFVASAGPLVALAFGWRAAIVFIGLVTALSGIVSAIVYREAVRPGPSSGRPPALGSSLGEVVRNRGLWMVGLIAILLVTVQNSFLAYLPIYLFETVLPPSTPDESTRLLAAGGYLALAQAGGLVGRIAWGLLSDRVLQGRRRILLATVGAISALAALTIGLAGPGIPLWLLTSVVFLLGMAANGWNGIYQVTIMETAGQRHAGTGVGFCMTLSQIGLVGGPPIFGFIVDTTRSYHAAWLFLALCALAGALVALAESGREKHSGWKS